jgi:hypothetical protein
VSYQDELLRERQVKALEEIAVALRDLVAILKAYQTVQPSTENKPQEGSN